MTIYNNVTVVEVGAEAEVEVGPHRRWRWGLGLNECKCMQVALHQCGWPGTVRCIRIQIVYPASEIDLRATCQWLLMGR
jgi:hypothetical protein